MKIKSLEDYVYTKQGVYGKGQEFEASKSEVERLQGLNFKIEVLEEDEQEEVIVPPPVEEEKVDPPVLENDPPRVNENLFAFNEILAKLKINSKALANLIRENNLEKIEGKYDVVLIEKLLEKGAEEEK